MEKYLNGIALLLVAAGLFTLSYIIYLQEDRGRWLPISHKGGVSAVLDSYTGRIWEIEYGSNEVYDHQVIDPTMGKTKKLAFDHFPPQKK
jgi:hypothetical protein